MADSTADIDRVWKLIEAIPIAMVVTHGGDGRNLRARPMAVRSARDEGVIYFLTDADAPKAEEIRRDQTVCLALADNKKQKYVSITGHAEMLDDRERIKKYWSVYDKAFWPVKDDPSIESSRDARQRRILGRVGDLVTAVKLAAAIASGERINLGGNEKDRASSPWQRSPTEARSLRLGFAVGSRTPR